MSNPAGISQENGRFFWSCGCGQAGEPTAFRETARSEYKEHRKTCTTSPTGEGKIMSTVAKSNVVKAPKASKTKVGKTEAKKKGGRPRGNAVSDSDAKSALGRLQKGETTLIAESKKLGFTHNGPLRAALRKLIGADKYAAMMKASDVKAAKTAKGTKKGAEKAVKAAKQATSTKPKAATKKTPTPKKKPIAPKYESESAPIAAETASEIAVGPSTTEG